MVEITSTKKHPYPLAALTPYTLARLRQVSRGVLLWAGILLVAPAATVGLWLFVLLNV